MLMPTLSVTGIGVLAALVAIGRGAPTPNALLRGLLGAWLGFLAGALPGVLIDVIVGDGIYVALLGHAGAAIGALVGLRRALRLPAAHRPQ